MTKRPHKSTEIIAKETATPLIVDGRLLEDIRGIIESAKSRFAQTANAALVTLYWNVGNRIKTDILGNERAQYGRQIVHALSGQLSWTHFVALIPMKAPLQHEFYAEMCCVERWSVRTLREGVE